MSIATHLVTVARSLSDILNDINLELVNKGSTDAATLDGVDEKIRAISGGGSTQDADAVAGDLRAGKTAYARGSKIVGTLASVTPGVPNISVSGQGVVTASVTQSAGIVNGATTSATHTLSSDDDSDFVESNIKAGVTIFGVTGNYSGSGPDTSDATASASDIKSGKTAYIATGKTTGTMSTVTAPNPSVSVSTGGVVTASYSMSSGYTAGGSKSGTHTLSSSDDSDFVASNIKHDVTIFGTTGSYPSGTMPNAITANGSGIDVRDYAYVDVAVPTGGTLSEITSSDVTFSTNGVTPGYVKILNTSGSNKQFSSSNDSVSKSVPNLSAENIKHGQTILGVTGSYPSGTMPTTITSNGSGIDVQDYAYVNVAVPTGETLSEITASDITLSSAYHHLTGGTIDVTNSSGSNKKFTSGSSKTISVPNLISENIRSGVTILDTAGSYTGGYTGLNTSGVDTLGINGLGTSGLRINLTGASSDILGVVVCHNQDVTYVQSNTIMSVVAYKSGLSIFCIHGADAALIQNSATWGTSELVITFSSLYPYSWDGSMSDYTVYQIVGT